MYKNYPKLFKPLQNGPKILLVDIETAPLLGYIWGLFDNNVALNQLHTDWYILSWSAKWYGTPEDQVMYADQRDEIDIENDKNILEPLWELLDQADIVVWQNGKQFDNKKINARMVFHGFSPPSPYRQIDTLEIAKRKFGFTSNKLEYMTGKLCKRHRKSKHKKFAGFELWREVLKGNLEAWNEMQDYNIEDVLSMEELYDILRPWDDKHPNLSVYSENERNVCRCGSTVFHKRGFAYTNLGKYQTYRCVDCGAYYKDRTNLLTKEHRKEIKGNIV